MKKISCSLELGLVLSNQPLASTEVSLSRAPAAVLGLIPLEVRIVLDELHEGHLLVRSKKKGEGNAGREMMRS